MSVCVNAHSCIIKNIGYVMVNWDVSGNLKHSVYTQVLLFEAFLE